MLVNKAALSFVLNAPFSFQENRTNAKLSLVNLLNPFKIDASRFVEENSTMLYNSTPKCTHKRTSASKISPSSQNSATLKGTIANTPQVTPQDYSNRNRRIRKIYICQEPGCSSTVVSKHRCVRHGGGTRCSVDGCEKGAKLRGKCFHHGGYKACSVEGCTSKAKRYGHCWSHGGGHPCKEEGCTKVATLGGFCWAHGGGNRCRMEGCEKRSYQQHDYLCKHHFRIHKQQNTTQDKQEQEADEEDTSSSSSKYDTTDSSVEEEEV